MIGCEQIISLQDRQMSDIKYWISSFKHILKTTNYGIGKVFRADEFVTLCDTVDDSREWLLETTIIIAYVPVQSRYYFFADSNYFVSRLRASVIEIDVWTG